MADFIVTTGEDVIDDTDNVLSLREALAQINAEASSQRQRIVFAEGVTEVEIRDGGLSLTAPNLTIDGDIDGDGLADVTLGGEVEGEYLLGASGGAALTLSSLMIRGVTVEAPRLDDGRDGADAADVNGANGRNGADGDGGRFIGVIKAEGALTLERVSISDVTVLGADGGDGGQGGDGQDRADRPRANGDGAAGRDGGDGGEGGEGGAGDNVAVIVANRSLTMTDSGISDAVQVLAGDGGTGGDGGAGGDGGDGGAGNNESGPLGGEGGDGGDGGSGGNGGDGGDGGSGGYAIAGIYFTGDEDDAELTGVGLGRFMSATAGDAGEAGEGGLRGTRGEGGAGGSGGTFAANGENGAPGAFGSAGSDGQTFFAGAVVGPLFPEIDGVSAPDAVVYVAGAGGAVTEGESLTVSLVRAGSVDSALTVSWTLEGGEGFAADDVAAFSGTARFEAGGPDVIEIEIATLLDDVRERDERFAFRLLDATPAEGSDETAGLGTAVLEAVIENARGAPDEVLTGTRRRDVLRGDRQDEDFFGLAGKDKLIGGGGADILHGGRGKDKLLGGGGQDVLHGGLQTDKLVGGRGADVFLFQTLRDAGRDGAGDRIVDFGRGADLIDLSGIDADAIARGDQAFTFIGAGDFSETAGELRQIDNLVQGDVNGDGEADFELRLLNGALLTSDDFVL